MSLVGYTANYKFGLIDYNTRPWSDDEYANWNTLDGVLGAFQNPIPFVVDTGAANAIVLTYAPAQTPVAGTRLSFKLANAAVGATTVNVNGHGAKALVINGANPLVGDFPAGQYVEVVYDGTSFIVKQPLVRAFGAVHVVISSSGATASTANSYLTVEKNADVGMSLLGPATAIFTWAAATPASSVRGGMKYNANTDVLSFVTAGNANVSISGAGVLTAVGLVGPLTGTASGNAVLGANNFTGQQKITRSNSSDMLSLVQGDPGSYNVEMVMSTGGTPTERWRLSAQSTDVSYDFYIKSPIANGGFGNSLRIEYTTGKVTAFANMLVVGTLDVQAAVVCGTTLVVNGKSTFTGGAIVSLPTVQDTHEAGTNGFVQTVKTGNYTAVLADRGGEFYFTNNATFTVPANGSVGFLNGTTLLVEAANGVTVTVNITSDTIRLLPANTTSSITITGPGYLALSKKTATEWWGVGANAV